ncbi:MAG TPA: MFS transporter, partial [Rhodopila sp.]|nr:MFS transporter [Rhodopila sp.]
AGVSLAALVAWELRRPEPLLALRLLLQRSFAAATAMNFATGLALYGSVYILPLYLSQTQGYDAQQIGETMMWAGLPQLVIFPMMPALLRRFDSRLVCAIGIVLFGASCLINGMTFSPDTADEQLRLTQVIRALGQPLLMSPLSQMATIGIPPAQAGNASALFNMMRNLGGSVGIAMMATLIDHREHYHFSIIAERITQNAARTEERIGQLAQTLSGDGADAHRQALASLAQLVRRQAEVMAYADAFWIIGAILIVASIGTLLLKRAAGTGGAAH